jgi:hypothetical protein
MTWPVRIAQLTAKESLTLKVFLNFSSTAQNEAHDRAAAIAILASFFSSESGCSFLKPPAHTILLDRSFFCCVSNFSARNGTLENRFQAPPRDD